MTWQLITGDCVQVMAGMDAASVDAVVTDPPYGIRFMGKAWDGAAIEAAAARSRELGPVPYDVSRGVHAVKATAAMHAGSYDLSVTANQAFQAWCTTWATEALRVLKPGGHLLSFGGTRTYHRLVCALEDAGFEIRDCLAWLYGSGFPKSLDVSKAIDKAAGAAREVVGSYRVGGNALTPTSEKGGTYGVGVPNTPPGDLNLTAPATPDAERWQGWGTALKPAFEPIVLARKPLSGTVAQNVLEHGTGALNVDGTRIETDGRPYREARKAQENEWDGDGPWKSSGYGEGETQVGRWPANVLLDAEAAAALDEQSGDRPGLKTQRYLTDSSGKSMFGLGAGPDVQHPGFNDAGGASRFFYTAKTSRSERNRGLYGWPEQMPDNAVDRASQRSGEEAASGRGSLTKPMANHHPTVKPVDLMQWLCRLITPPGGLVLDPFTGSGSTGIAALREGFSFVGIEREPDYVEIARARIIGDAPLFNVENV